MNKRLLISLSAGFLLAGVLGGLFFALSTGGSEDNTAPARGAGSLALSPEAGVDGTNATISVSGVAPDASARVTFSDGSPASSLSVGPSGTGSVKQAFAG